MSRAAHIFTKPYVILLTAAAATLLWGSAFPCVKLGYEAFAINEADSASKLVFAGWRFMFAGLITLAFVCLRNRKIVTLSKSKWGLTAALGVVQTTLEYIFFYIGLSHVTGVKGSILNATGVFFAVILSRLVFPEDKLSPKKILGCVIGFCGILAINLRGDMGSGFRFDGEGFMLLAAACFAVGSLLNKRAAENEDAAAVTGYQLFIGGALLLAAGYIGGGSLPRVTASGVLLLSYMSALSAVAFTLWSLLLKYNPVGKVSVYHFLTPVFGAALSSVFLKEALFSAETLIALALVCVGIAVVNLPERLGQKNK